MKKLLLLSALLILSCTDDEGNPCVYEPTLTTEAVTDITETSATLNGIIAIESENCDVPNNAEQGFVYSTEIQPTLADIQVNVNGANISTNIEGLIPNTTYYVRAFLTNNFGDFYGDEVSFTTIDGLINCDGNPVPTIVYGTQEWTVENACHTTYRDGTPIPEVTDNTEWESLTTGAWAYYNNDPTKHRLYNWFAVMGIHDNDDSTPNKDFAPEGWHIPNSDEWTTLINHLINNGYGTFQWQTDILAKSMASATGWLCELPETSANGDWSIGQYNTSGFNAFSLGYRNGYNPNGYSGISTGVGGSTFFWSLSEYYEDADYWLSSSLNIQCDYNTVQIGTSRKSQGLSIRLVKD